MLHVNGLSVPVLNFTFQLVVTGYNWLQLLVLSLNSKVSLICIWAPCDSYSCYGCSCIIAMKLFHMAPEMMFLDKFRSTDVTFMFSLLAMSMD